MAVIVSKVDKGDVPPEHSHGEGEALFNVTDEEGNERCVKGEEAAARLAVDLSERAKAKKDP